MSRESVKLRPSAVVVWLGAAVIDGAGEGTGTAVARGAQAEMIRVITERMRGKVFFIACSSQVMTNNP